MRAPLTACVRASNPGSFASIRTWNYAVRDGCDRQAGPLRCPASSQERFDRARLSASGLFCCSERGSDMANHLTPDELSKELGIERQEVIRVCLQEGVP